MYPENPEPKHGTLTVTIPKDRIGVLIGVNGSVKKTIEEKLDVKLTIDSDGGVVSIELAKSPNEGGDPAAIFKARDIVVAIGRGFSPERAFRLFEEDVVLDIVHLEDFIGKNVNDLVRIRARLIGTGGKTRKIIEENAHVFVSIYGDTVAIIGDPQDVEAAKEAVIRLITGSPHSAVYKMLDEYARKRKTGRLIPGFKL
ncbi:MAG: KH domain-containing protein [Nitrososphaerota archaeon]|nr:KH domain-containing protein [Aigarchaeota archaeon]MDW8076330.1 KH domain-containing protein [Nitrososphaerota archaeon]